MGALDDKFKLIDGATDEFFEALEALDNELALQIIKLYTQFVQRGQLVLDAEKLAALDDAIVAAVKNTNYKLVVDTYIPNFDAISALNVEIHKLENGINVQDVIRESDRINNHRAAVEAHLRGTNAMTLQVTEGGVKRVVSVDNDSLNQLIKPIGDMIRQDIIMGVSFESATEQMLQAIADKNLGLERWAGQIARDALSQHDGIQQQSIKDEFDLKFSRYIGTIKNTTRPLCYHMLTKKDEPVYTDDELRAILSEFAPGGVPSDSTTSNTANGKQQRKGSGIMPGTEVANFHTRRGGYGCRHQYIPAARE